MNQPVAVNKFQDAPQSTVAALVFTPKDSIVVPHQGMSGDEFFCTGRTRSYFKVRNNCGIWLQLPSFFQSLCFFSE